jgi:hypothetical protein
MAMQERLAVLDEVKLRKMRRALDIADEQLELKRDRVSDALKALVSEPYHGCPWFRYPWLMMCQKGLCFTILLDCYHNPLSDGNPY